MLTAQKCNQCLSSGWYSSADIKTAATLSKQDFLLHSGVCCKPQHSTEMYCNVLINLLRMAGQVIDLKGELANSKAGQAAIKHAVAAAAKEQAAGAAREKALKVEMK